MKDDIPKLRMRLQELHDLRTTGFVDEKQYVESLAYLERKLADAALMHKVREEAADADFPATVLAGDEPEAPDGHAGAFAAPNKKRRSSSQPWWPWALAAVTVHLIGLGVWWWADTQPVVAPAASANVASVAPAPASSSAIAVAGQASAVVGAAAPGAFVAGPPNSISGTVVLSPALASRVQPGDTLFVYARAIDGPAMPLAVIRKQVRDLPFAFTLDDSMAVWPAAKVSAFPKVQVTARISRSGEGEVRRGDLQGQSPTVAGGVSGLQIEIGSVVE